MTAPHRKPIRTDLEAEPRCTSRFASHRCRLKPGHSGAHDGGPGENGARIVWGYRRGKR